MFKNKIRNIFLAFCGALLFIISCKKDAVVTPSSSIDAVISGNANLSIFNAALAKTNLTIFSKGGGPFTLYAPTNAAFAAIGVNSVSDLSSVDSVSLSQLIAYHIQAVSRSYTEIPQGSMSTQSGFSLYGTRLPNGTAYVNGANISGRGTQCSNGFLYEVDRVLIPNFSSLLATTILTNAGSKLMVQAAAKTSVLLSNSPSTILAIPNSVMTAEGYDSTTIANLVPASLAFTKLQSIIRYHIIPLRLFSTDFKAGTLKTVQGSNVTISGGSGASVSVKGTNNSSSFILNNTNGVIANGVIHGITGLLKP
jgi:uncharacterized surface protein with fasciclin (FAS1) repeats